MSKLKPPKAKAKGGIWVAIVTIVFAIIGVTLAIIGYQNEVLHWLGTTGVALAVVAFLPSVLFAYNVINKKIDS